MKRNAHQSIRSAHTDSNTGKDHTRIELVESYFDSTARNGQIYITAPKESTISF